MAAALIIRPFCSNHGSVVGFVIGIVMSVFVVVVVVVLAHPAVSSSVVATTTSRDIGRWGARVGTQSQQDWARRRVNLERRRKKVKNHGIVHRVTHNFYVKINPRQILGDAVACTSVPLCNCIAQFTTQE